MAEGKIVERKRTLKEILAEANRIRTAPLITEEKNNLLIRAYNLVNKNPIGRFLRNTTIVAVVGLGSAYTATSYSNARNEANNTRDVLSETPLEQDIGKVLYAKKEAYITLLSREPSNTEAQKELQKLDLLITAYEQTYNSKPEVK